MAAGVESGCGVRRPFFMLEFLRKQAEDIHA